MDLTTRFSLDQQLRPAAADPLPTLPVLPTAPADPLLTVHHWSDTHLSLPLHATFIFLTSTVLITLTLSPSSPPSLPPPSLTLHTPSPASPVDAVTTSALGGGGESFSTALSGRLARSFQRHFLCMADVGRAVGAGEAGGVRAAGEEDVEMWVERRVMRELKECRERGMWE